MLNCGHTDVCPGQRMTLQHPSVPLAQPDDIDVCALLIWRAHCLRIHQALRTHRMHKWACMWLIIQHRLVPKLTSPLHCQHENDPQTKRHEWIRFSPPKWVWRKLRLTIHQKTGAYFHFVHWPLFDTEGDQKHHFKCNNGAAGCFAPTLICLFESLWRRR